MQAKGHRFKSGYLHTHFMMFYSRTEQFQLVSIVPLYKGSVDLSITNRFVYLVATRTLMRLFASRRFVLQNHLIPSTEMLVYEGIRSFTSGMTVDQMGAHKSAQDKYKFFPLVLTIFMLILGRNLMGMIPHTYPRIMAMVTYLALSSIRLPHMDILSHIPRLQRVLLAARVYARPTTTTTASRPRLEGLLNSMDHPHAKTTAVSNRHLHAVAPAKISDTEIVVTKQRKNLRIQGRIFVRALTLLSSAPRRFTPTSHLRFTFRVSRSLFLGLVFYSLERHGLHFFAFFFPAGIPFALAPFIVVLEMISFFFRPVSLGVRLRANMTAGHLLLHTVRGFVRKLLSASGIIFPIVGRRRRVILEGVFLLETRVCFLQAYVFTALFTIYLKDAEDLH